MLPGPLVLGCLGGLWATLHIQPRIPSHIYGTDAQKQGCFLTQLGHLRQLLVGPTLTLPLGKAGTSCLHPPWVP